MEIVEIRSDTPRGDQSQVATRRGWILDTSPRIVLLFLTIVLGSCSASESDLLPSLTIGSPAPEFSLPALDGSELDSRSLVGKTVVLNFWATWCEPCRREIPELEALASAGRVEVVSIALDQEGARTIRPFVERHGISYTVLLGDHEVFERFHGLAIPYTLVLDRSQRIREIYRGPTSRVLVESDLQRHEDET